MHHRFGNRLQKSRSAGRQSAQLQVKDDRDIACAQQIGELLQSAGLAHPALAGQEEGWAPRALFERRFQLSDQISASYEEGIPQFKHWSRFIRVFNPGASFAPSL